MQMTDCYQANAHHSFCEAIGLHLQPPAIMLVSFPLISRLMVCSYLLIDTYLLLTHSFIQLEFKISDNEPSAHDETYRRVERGARIVLATQLKPNLVLQVSSSCSYLCKHAHMLG